jgi:CRP-like cAMP-binding protein
MYLIVTGRVEIVQTEEEGSILHLATFGTGDFFGEQALLDESPRTATALAVEPCQAVGFFRPDLLALIESDPRLGLKIVMQLSQMISVRLRHTNRLLKEARDAAKEADLAKSQREDLKTKVAEVEEANQPAEKEQTA